MPWVHRIARLVVAALAGALLLGALGTGAGAGRGTRPGAPAAVPRTPEGFTPYLPQVSCDPVVKPGTARCARC